uniref:Uncharacterized protein n=1 Tax=Anguilla anguilla TaxID=7936 RepID=A0A0E9XG53_ANGAN
MEGGGKNTAPD